MPLDNCGHDPAVRLACCSASSVEPMPSPYAKRTLAEVEASADELAQKFMDYEPPTLTAFLLARIVDDEATATALRDGDVQSLWDLGYQTFDTIGAARMTIGDPARLLAECGVKRGIIEEARALINSFGDWDAEVDAPALWSDVNRRERGMARNRLRDLASAYADHPDCREEWKP